MRHVHSAMRATADPETFNIMSINTALPGTITKDWGYVGYKGGSETGVLNMTWLLTDSDGRDHILTLGWANSEAAVETQKLLLLAQRILSLPR